MATSIALDKIPLHSKQQSKEEWQFASFSRNTLTGAYGNLSNSLNSQALPETVKPKQLVEDVSVPSKPDCGEKNLKSQVPNLSNAETISTKQSHQVSTKTTNQEIFQKIRQFLYIFQPEKDQQRFLDLCKFLLNNAKTESSTKV